MHPRILRIAAWVIGILALIFWAQVILGVAVFAIPDRYDAPESIALSLITVAIGIGVPIAAIWSFFAFAVPRHSRVPGEGPGNPAPPPGSPQLHPEPPPLVEPLTTRELDVLRAVAMGRSNKEIANELVISTGTVKTHTNNLFRKLGASNRTEAVDLARRHDLL